MCSVANVSSDFQGLEIVNPMAAEKKVQEVSHYMAIVPWQYVSFTVTG